MSDRRPSSKYEIVPSLWIGSEIGDIDREIKVLIKRLVDGDESVLLEITSLSRKREQLLMSKRFRNDTT
jgi:hypothetical protein